MNSQDVLARYQPLYAGLVSDAVEALDLGPRAAAPDLAPFHTQRLRVAVGWAFPIEVRQTSERVEIDRLLDAVAASPVDSMVVVAADVDVHGALWGGLMTTGVQQRGARGAVVDGGIRDLHQVLPADFAVWAGYRSPLDIRGRAEVVGHGSPVSFRGVRVEPRDLVFADATGVVVVPAGQILTVLDYCENRRKDEVATNKALAAGDEPSAVYERYGAF